MCLMHVRMCKKFVRCAMFAHLSHQDILPTHFAIFHIDMYLGRIPNRTRSRRFAYLNLSDHYISHFIEPKGDPKGGW